jgi:hypothetical protein
MGLGRSRAGRRGGSTVRASISVRARFALVRSIASDNKYSQNGIQVDCIEYPDHPEGLACEIFMKMLVLGCRPTASANM